MSTALQNLRATLQQNLAARRAMLPPATSPTIRTTQDKFFEFPDGTRTDKPFTAIILDWRYTNAYYKSAWRPGVQETPLCWAVSSDANTIAPSELSAKPQHTSCEGCPRNEWGSGNNGRGKACGNRIRIALVPPDATTTTAVNILTISPTALKHFNKLVAGLINAGRDPIEFIAKIGFNPDESFANVLATINPNDTHENEAVLVLREKAQALLNRGFDYDD